MILKRRVEIYIKVIYHGLLDNNNAIIGDEGSRPITFHDYAFRGLNNEFRDYRRRHIDQSCPEIEGKWETFIGDDYCQFGIWGYPDKQINVSENPEGRFPTLFPGESWSNFWKITADGYSLPDDLKPGERLRYQFKGNALDWWDWGTAETHAQTIVTLPGSGVEPISDPRDNGGRPKVVVPASNTVEWMVVGE